jgi:cobalt/nickel transport system permease protein
MHLPDGFLPAWLGALGWLLALAGIGIALRRSDRSCDDRQLPLMGVLAAFVFAAQALNFPIAAGTSGHLLGGSLLALLIGPWAAVVSMTAVTMLQGLVFQDGGLLVMGWNILNLAVFSCLSGWAIAHWAGYRSPDRRRRLAGAFVGAWLSVELSAMAAAVELAVGGTFPLWLGLPAMAGSHAVIGAVEAAITVAVLVFLDAVRPALVRPREAEGRPANWVVLGLAVALVFASLSPLASPLPDALEAAALAGGFAGRATAGPSLGLVDYTWPGIASPALATLLAVAVGTLLVYALGTLLAGWLGRRR